MENLSSVAHALDTGNPADPPLTLTAINNRVDITDTSGNHLATIEAASGHISVIGNATAAVTLYEGIATRVIDIVLNASMPAPPAAALIWRLRSEGEPPIPSDLQIPQILKDRSENDEERPLRLAR